MDANANDIREFRAYLRQCTDDQVRGVWEKETAAGRYDYAELAAAEAESRGIEVRQ
jgi:hypothetical protein